MRMRPTRTLLSILIATLGGCSIGTTILEDDRASAQTWTDLTLEISGPAATRGTVSACVQEARKAGIRLRPGAPLQASLALSEHDNSVKAAGQSFAISQKLNPAVCRIALAKAVSLDERVQIGKTDPPANCRPLGTVAGSDQGEMNGEPGSTEASRIGAQFAALQNGANYLVVDRSESFYSEGSWGDTIVKTTGRAFACGEPPAMISPPTPGP
jgi:hypothetical protein